MFSSPKQQFICTIHHRTASFWENFFFFKRRRPATFLLLPYMHFYTNMPAWLTLFKVVTKTTATIEHSQCVTLLLNPFLLKPKTNSTKDHSPHPPSRQHTHTHTSTCWLFPGGHLEVNGRFALFHVFKDDELHPGMEEVFCKWCWRGEPTCAPTCLL